MKTLIFLLLLSVSFFVFPQKIQVLDNKIQEPIIGVAVFNDDKTKSAITDFDGFVDISQFTNSEEITFQHLSHVSITLTKSEIIKKGNVAFRMFPIGSSEIP